MTERRLLIAAAIAAPLLTTIAIATDEGVTLGGAVGFVVAWTLFTYLVVALAAWDLRRPGSRGRVAFISGLAAAVLALSLWIAGGIAVLPALLLIPLAASTGHRGRRLLSLGLLTGSCALYAAVLATVD